MPKIIEEQCGVPTPSDGEMSEANVIQLLGVAPAFAMALTFLTAAQSTGVLFENSVATAQRQNTIAQCALTQGILHIHSVGTMAAATSVAHMDPKEVEQAADSLLSNMCKYFKR
ncbi:RebB family R body protein [Pseudovibrio sp. Tun.PSC04-5.I4]|uniref:RebB family R body protein n=1 Tax=Pseudovibrio sp. Tun.PSC04-5.I4 TaxID=1798213 RepID=UPI0008864D2A|nr:RebB family R body protein [Pseudovibrio sp. Tun.PSC04-5.I4]SDR36496.1 Killing trait domain-containing protein [Pseudovibrio sp. Tun.PSC04-5.I4]